MGPRRSRTAGHASRPRMDAASAARAAIRSHVLKRLARPPVSRNAPAMRVWVTQRKRDEPRPGAAAGAKCHGTRVTKNQLLFWEGHSVGVTPAHCAGPVDPALRLIGEVLIILILRFLTCRFARWERSLEISAERRRCLQLNIASPARSRDTNHPVFGARAAY
jgi:hypothetical protein